MLKAPLLIFLALINIELCYSYCADETYTRDSGNIQVSNYARGTSCTKEVKLSQRNRWIKLTWKSFNVDGDMPNCKDYVAIYTGCSISNRVAKFCSNNLVSLPHDIYSKDGCMKIQLVTSGSTSKKNLGFEVGYSSGYGPIDNSISSCRSKNRDKTGSSGIISSPNWPDPYDYSKVGSFLDRECEWDIKRSSQELIQLNLMDVDLKNSNYCLLKPYLKVEETKYCRREKPLTINTDYYKVEIKLKVPNYSSSSNTNRGFAVGWVTYKSNNDGSISHTSSVTLVGVVVIILIVIVCVVVGVRYWKARNIRTTNYSSTASTNPIVLNQTTSTVNQSGGAAYPSQPYMAQPSYQMDSKPYPGAPPSYSEVTGHNLPQGAGYQLQGSGYPPQEQGYPQQQPPSYPPPGAGYPQQPYGAGYPSQ